ncbi:MAG: nodulation protein NfeD [Gammaproteobacteria bacterium]|nr:MAG: nodulation protein NfeD [Gammaproteobacteria bacterium]
MRYLTLAIVALQLVGPHAVGQETARAQALLLELNGPIGPAVSDFIERGIERAAADGNRAVILRIDTPGGLDTSMRVIIKSILASPVPVIVYVAPSGARAASAGTYILYASHYAAMAPATNLGAATPVPIGPGATPPGDDGRSPAKKDSEGSEDGNKEPVSPQTAMGRKVLNDAVAYIRGLAELRGRNAEWAEEAVRVGASLSAEEALARNVIDAMAEDVDDLLAKLDGQKIKIGDAEITLDTGDWTVETVEPDWRSKLLAVITNPNVAYILMLLGIYGLFFELYNPGAVIPGVVGAISLVLALYAFQVLPVNFAGVTLVLIGVALIVTELFLPSFGAIGIGGVVAFIIGSIILMDTDVEGYTVSMPLVITVAVATAALFTATVLIAVRQRKRPIVSGREEMIGATAEALEAFSEFGQVRAHGEIWSARVSEAVARGQILRIKNIDGLTLEVEPDREEK